MNQYGLHCEQYLKLPETTYLSIFWPKIPTFWPKNKIYDLNVIGVYLYVFWDNKSIGIYVKISQDYQKPCFFGHFRSKMAKLSFNWTLIGLIEQKIEKSIWMFQELLVSTRMNILSLRIIIEAKTIPR